MRAYILLMHVPFAPGSKFRLLNIDVPPREKASAFAKACALLMVAFLGVLVQRLRLDSSHDTQGAGFSMSFSACLKISL